MPTSTLDYDSDIANAMSEAALQNAIYELAKTLGWRVAHFRPAKTERGWRTAGSYDAAGFPDMVLVKFGRVLFFECKSEKGIPSVEQRDWIDALNYNRKRCFLVRPSHWLNGSVEKMLRGEI